MIYILNFICKEYKVSRKDFKIKKILGSKCMAVTELKCEFEEKKKP